MCGIIGVVRRPADREPPTADELLGLLDAALAGFPDATPLERVDELLRGVAGVRALLADDALAAAIGDRMGELARCVQAREADLDAAGGSDLDVEAANAELVRLKDAVWAIRNDRLPTAAAVRELAGDGRPPPPAAVAAYLSIQIALSAIDRLEVRGRDSAGIHVLVTGHAVGLDSDEVHRQLEQRSDPLFTSGAVRTPEGHLAFVYKAAAEIGELGDNTHALRGAIIDDGLLRAAVNSSDTAEATVLGHTRWASVGIISEPNAHPLDSLEEGRTNPYAAAALNGDVDNHAALVEAHGLCIPSAVTTDAKVIPTLVARRRDDGAGLVDAFRESVATFDGSVAIAVNAAEQPGTLLLAQRGSGQSLYVGIADDAYVVASEPYGVVEQTRRYVRMDGETPSGVDGTSGQIVVVGPDGLRRFAYDGTELPVTDADVVTADITTRDIDRGGAPHFLLKEIGESPQSVRKTLRGKIVEDGGRLDVALPDDALPESVRTRLGDGSLRRVLVIGQGTAAVAGQSLAAFLEDEFAGSTRIATALPATELSGFSLTDDMSDTLVVAISQSGTTTDTNRTVDLVRARGAAVLAIVNRRNSDLGERADGVLYTSDGRDVEMSVASTKAFYAQIAAGALLALAISDAAGCADRSRTSDLLAGLRALPDAMEGVLQRRDAIAAAAQEFAPPRRYWAMVGNGRNRIAAQELRIKLSELCYKSIAADATEDKKHIDLSSEPMILVCAAGLAGATADDVAKEVAIYRAHKAAPIVIATEGGNRFSSALAVIDVPPVHPAFAFVLSAMAGHLFGYEAALAIDAQARQLREIRAAVEQAVTLGLEGDALLRHLDRALDGLVAAWFRTLRSGALNGHLEAATAVRLASLFGYATGLVPVDAYEAEYGRAGTPEAVVNDLLDALDDAVDELTRPIDAIKHQAKTVTVGISRSEEAYFESRLVRDVLTAGAGRDRLSYRALRSLAELDPAVETVTGWTRYAVEGDVADHTATATIVDRGGVARDIESRTDRDPRLTGTKHRAAFEREVTVAVGRRDDRPIVIVPETKDNQVTGLTLLHARFRDHLPADVARRVLSGYRGRYQALVDAVTETEPSFDDSVLAEVPILELLTEPVYVLASHWRR
jgi:glucosamine--fructose-6-phosphate aminotransferase (isomerizing)